MLTHINLLDTQHCIPAPQPSPMYVSGTNLVVYCLRSPSTLEQLADKVWWHFSEKGLNHWLLKSCHQKNHKKTFSEENSHQQSFHRNANCDCWHIEILVKVHFHWKTWSAQILSTVFQQYLRVKLPFLKLESFNSVFSAYFQRLFCFCILISHLLLS